MRVKAEIPLTFEEFGWRALEERARAEDVELERLLALACSHYTAELAAERAATVAPRFDQPPVERETREPRSLVLELDAEVLERLEQEAELQGIALGRLCEHAALLYLADLDADPATEGNVRRAGPDAGGEAGPEPAGRDELSSVPRKIRT